MRAILLLLMLATAVALSSNAAETLQFGKEYKGLELELETELTSFSGDGGNYLELHCDQKVNDVKFILVARLRNPRNVDYDELTASKVRLRIKGRCNNQSIHNSPNKVMFIFLEDASYSILDAGAKNLLKDEANLGVLAFDDKALGNKKFTETDLMRSIVTVKGAKGSNSGFIARYNGKKYLITSIHAIFDNEISFFNANNEKIEVSSSPTLAADRDVAFFELKEDNPLPALKVEPDISTLEQGHPIIVYGNSLGDEANIRLGGKILAMGPQNLEISAEIVPGNSGSPIISARTGNVVGIASYGVISKPTFSTKGTRFEDVRRFGYRLDTLRDIQPFDKAKYLSDIKIHNAIDDMNELALIILRDIYESYDGKWIPDLDPAKYDTKKYPSMQGVIRDWNELIKGGKKSMNTTESVLKRLKNQISSPIASMKNTPIHYKWIKEQVEKQIELNEYYCTVFDKIRREVEEDRRQNKP